MKAQVQLMETVAVLVIFFILVAIGFTFYANVVKTSFNREETSRMETTAVEIAARTMQAMEFSCSEDNVPREGCLDQVKLAVAPPYLASNAADFFSLFGFSNIVARKVFPSTQEWVLWNNPLNDASVSTVIHLPVNIWDPVSGEYSLGEMRVEVFS